MQKEAQHWCVLTWKLMVPAQHLEEVLGPNSTRIGFLLSKVGAQLVLCVNQLLDKVCPQGKLCLTSKSIRSH